MKKLLLFTLVAVNLALLAVVIERGPDGQAQAQVGRGGASFTAITAKIGPDEDAQFVVDPRTRSLFGIRVDTSRKDARLIIFGARDLVRDFGIADETQP